MAEFNPYKLEEEKWTPKNVYEILPPNAVSWSDYDFGQGTDNVDQEAAKKSLIDGFVDFFKELFGTAGQILGGAIELGGAVLGGFVNGVIGFIGGIANAIGSIFGSTSETPYPPMFSPIKANLEAAVQPLQDKIDESVGKSEELLAEQAVISGQIAEQVDITRAAVADAKAASERAGTAITEAEAASTAATEARETLESYNTELNKRITSEFNAAVGRADTAISQAEANNAELVTMNTQLGEITQQAADLNTKLGEHNKKFTDGLATANTAIDEAVSVTAAVKKVADENKAKVASAISKADKANADLALMSPKVADAVAKSDAATDNVATLTPKVSDAVTQAGAAVDKADAVTSAYNTFKTQQKARIDTAVSKADKASSDVSTLTPKVSDAVSKAGKASSDVSALTPKVTSASKDAAKASQDVAALSPKVTDAVSKSDKAVADVAAFNLKVTAASNKATQAASDVADLTPKVTAAQDKADKAASDLSTLTPKVTAAQSRADAAYTEAGKVRSEVTPKIEDAQTKGETALVAADKAIADSEFIAGFADDLIPKDENGKSTWGSQLEPGDVSPPESAFGSERTYIMSSNTTGPEPFIPVKGQEVYRLTGWVKEHPDSTNRGFSFHLRSATGYAGWTHVRMNFGEWQTKAEQSTPYVSVPNDRWGKYTLDFRWPESAGPAYPYLAQNSGGKFYVHDVQVRVISPVDNSVDQAQNDAIKANQDILRQQEEINEAQRVANLAQDNFNDSQTKWNTTSANATQALADAAKAQKDINAEQTKFNKFQTEFNKDQIKWNKASSNATKALTAAANAQDDINAEQKKFNTFQTQFNKDQIEWNDAVARSIATQATVDENFKKWTDGAAEAITANTNAIKALNAPQTGSSIVPMVPGTNTPAWIEPLRSFDRGAQTADSVLPESISQYYRYSGGSIPAGESQNVDIPYRNGVTVDPNLEYEVSWYTRVTSGKARYIYISMASPETGRYIVEKARDGEASGNTWGNPPRPLITPASTTWTKHTSRFKFKPGTRTVYITDIQFNNSTNDKRAYLYIADLQIAPKVPNQAQVDDAQNKALEAYGLFQANQEDWNEGTTAALATQATVDENFKKWTDGADKAITANTNALAILSAPQGASSIIPTNPLTKEPYYIGWTGQRMTLNSSVPTTVGTRNMSAARKRVYAPSDELVPVKVARGQVYRWTAWVYSSVADSSILLYFRDPDTGTGTASTTHDKESKTRGHSRYGLFLRGIPSGWNKVSGTMTFKDEISSLEMYSIGWNYYGSSSSVTQYITGFDIAPDVPTQAQVDDAQNKAIKANKDLLVEQERINQEQKKLNKLNTAFETEQKKINDKQTGINALNTKADSSLLQGLKALGKKSLGASLVPYKTPSDWEVKNYNAGKLSYDPWADPEYINAGHKIAGSSKGRTPEAAANDGTVAFEGSPVTVDSSIWHKVKFKTWASNPGSCLVIYMVNQNGDLALAETPFADKGRTSGGLVSYLTLPNGWKEWEGIVKFSQETTSVRLGTFYWNHPKGTTTARQFFMDLEIIPDIPDANVVNELQDNAIRKQTEVGTENKAAIDALTEGMDAYVAAADLVSTRQEISAELEQQSLAREALEKELNQAIVEAVPRTIIYDSGKPQFNDHFESIERTKIIAKKGWVGQMVLDVTWRDGDKVYRDITTYPVPGTDGNRRYIVPSASFGSAHPAYRIDYWVYRGKAVQRSLVSRGGYLTGSTHKGNTWTQIVSHKVKKTNGVVYFRWTTRLKKADRGRTYYFDVKVNGTRVIYKAFKGYGPLTGLGDGRATLTFSGTLNVPDGGKITVHTKSTGTSTQASVSSNRGLVSYLELE